LVDDHEQGGLFPLLPPRGPIPPKVKRPTHPVWSESKARFIERYLYYFVQVTKHGTYIDAFAGPQQPDKPDSWAAKLVLESEPRWFRHFFLYDIDADQAKRLSELRQGQLQRSDPRRDIQVVQGDCNVEIPKLLGSRVIKEKEATFCLLDQRTFECRWATLQALARYKTGNKIELFYFLANSWFSRALSGIREGGGTKTVKQWWGRDDWKSLATKDSRQRVDLMVDRFRSELGYAFVNPWAIYGREDGGRIMYYMIHATDHPEAPKLMARAYERAVLPKEPVEQLALDFELPSKLRTCASASTPRSNPRPYEVHVPDYRSTAHVRRG